MSQNETQTKQASPLSKKLYTTKSKSTGGRDGQTKSLDGNFEANLSTPRELGGAGGSGTNPEQLFASGYSACFLNAVKFVSMQHKVPFDAANSYAEATVSIGHAAIGFGLEVELEVVLPNLAQAEAERIVAIAHQTCPYSNAVRGNVDVQIKVRGQ